MTIPATDTVPAHPTPLAFLGGWLVVTHHKHPEKLHLLGCRHVEWPPEIYPAGSTAVGLYRTPTRRELRDLACCVDCVSRAAKAGQRL